MIIKVLQQLKRPVYLKSCRSHDGNCRDLLVGNPTKSVTSSCSTHVKDTIHATKHTQNVCITEALSLANGVIEALPFTDLRFSKGWIGAAPYSQALPAESNRENFAEDDDHGFANNFANFADSNTDNNKANDLARDGTDSSFIAAYYVWSYQYDHHLEQGIIYFSDECSEENKRLVLGVIGEHQKNQEDVSISGLSTANTDNFGKEAPNTPPITSFTNLNWNPSQNETDYRGQFDRIQSYIKEGDCYQVNLTQRFETQHDLAKEEVLKLFIKHAEDSGAGYCAYFEISDTQQLLSFSPEQFLYAHGAQIQTKPIKGTIKNAGKLEFNDIAQLKTGKNLAENLMIVDLLRNDLGKVCENGSINVDKLFEIESYENVHHLVSTIKGTLTPSVLAIDAFFSAFPGGSITGAPKIRAMEIIEELEMHQRRYYCGSIFYSSATGHFDSSILIRTVERIGNTLLCWGGGGIVSDSEVNSEYQESLDKVSQITGIES